jgi:eukaryotic-like serine/threonine-protein kinase
MAIESASPAVVRFGTFELDLRSGELRKQGLRVKLQEQPFRVLTVLLHRSGEVVTREDLRSQIWPADTFVDFDNGLNTAINKLREALGDSADGPRFIQTLPRRGYRFIAPVTTTDRSVSIVDGGPGATNPILKWRIAGLGAICLLAAVASLGLFWRWRQARRFTEKDTIVLADFANTTGDPVFDDTLKQGLRVQLEQSPYLSLLSDQQLGEELRLMAWQPSDRLTRELARDLCLRIGSKAILTGSISRLGSHYVIGVSASNCSTGSEFTSQQSEAVDKEHVLPALGSIASKIREKLGESLASIQKFDVPIEQVTTSSLEALRAYSLGRKYGTVYQFREAVLQLQRAVELDPDFASAYVRLWQAQFYLGQMPSAEQSLARAYALRGRTSERERFLISQKHACDLDQSLAIAELWAQTYPRDSEARLILADGAMWKGNWEEAVRQGQVALDLDPNYNTNYFNLAVSELALDRLDEASAICDRAAWRKMNDAPIHQVRYWIAFVRRDLAEMKHQVKVLEDLARENPDTEGDLLTVEAATQMSFGRISSARELVERAVASGTRSGSVTIAPRLYSFWALFSAETGNRSEARAYIRRVAGQPADPAIALAAARAGEVRLTERSATQFDQVPSNWWLRNRVDPVVHAVIAMDRRKAGKAVEDLRAANSDTQWAGNDPSSLDGLMTAYLRGEAYLQLHQGREAATEFQRLIDHPGIVVNSPFGPLARVGLGRAFVLQGDRLKARTEYEQFFGLWKDADPGIPIVKEAKMEYAKLH